VNKRKRSSSGILYRVVQTATHIQTGNKLVSRYGAYRTYAEAETKLRADQEAVVGNPQYEYDYTIEAVSPLEFSK
jgi:hypothetical protein